MENKLEVLNQIEKIRFYIKDPESAGEALIFAKKLKEFADGIEKKVKDRAIEIMNDEEIKQIETNGFTIFWQEPTEMIEYDVKNVLEALGDKALPALKVTSGKLKAILSKGIMTKTLTNSQIEDCQKGQIIKPKTGFIKIITKEQNEKI